jgi:hypothetical protein
MAPAFLATVALLLVAPGGAGRALPALPADSSLLAHSMELRLQARAAQSPPPRLQLLHADSQIAQCLQRRRADPTQIAATVQKGLTAVVGAVKHFMMQPPEIEQGLDVLGRGLLEAISEPIREQYSNATAYAAFEQEWMSFFDNAASTAPTVQGNITLFQEEGRPDAVIMAISDILFLLSDGVVRFVPHQTAQEVAKYVDAVGDLLGAVGASWGGFSTSGQEAQAIEDLYFALRGVLDQVLPEDLRNDETYKLIIGTLDGVISSLSETVLDFQRQIVEGKVCWKVQEARQKTRPSVCPEGFYWNGEQLCLPRPTQEPAALLQARRAGTAGGLERAVAGKVDSSAGAKVPIPDGAMVALCEETGNYTEKIGHWCYAACPAGMAPVGLQCKTQCQGEFPADDGAMMCGHNPGVLAEAVMNMVIGVATSAINAGLLIASMANDGVDTDSLVNTIQAFVNMGKPFAYQTCPLPGR